MKKKKKTKIQTSSKTALSQTLQMFCYIASSSLWLVTRSIAHNTGDLKDRTERFKQNIQMNECDEEKKLKEKKKKTKAKNGSDRKFTPTLNQKPEELQWFQWQMSLQFTVSTAINISFPALRRTVSA